MHVAIASHQKLDDFAAIESNELEQDVADLAPTHQHRHIAGSAAQHLRCGISAPIQIKLAADFAEAALRRFDGRKKLIELRAAHIEPGVEGCGRQIGVNLDGARDRTTSHSQRNWVKLQHTTFKHDVNAALVQRKFLHVPDICGGIGHVSIHALELGKIQHRRWQNFAGSLGTGYVGHSGLGFRALRARSG